MVPVSWCYRAQVIRRRRLLLLAVLVASMCPVVVAGPIASLREGRVILQLPPDWQRIDQEELDLVTMWAAEVTGGRVGELWEAGVAPAAGDLQLGPPFVLIQVDESGRISYGELAILPELESIQARVDANRDRGDRLGTGSMRLQSIHFDRTRFALETISGLATSPWGELEIHTLTYLTEAGSLTLHGYLGAQADPLQRRAVAAVLDNVLIAENLAYRPRLRDRWLDLSRRPEFWYTLAGAMAIATWAVARRTRRRPRS